MEPTDPRLEESEPIEVVFVIHDPDGGHDLLYASALSGFMSDDGEFIIPFRNKENMEDCLRITLNIMKGPGIVNIPPPES